jgi:AraC-like DNA-binding protein
VSYQARFPAPPLGDFVEQLWLFRGRTSPPNQRERLLPIGTMELVFDLGAPRDNGLLVGVHSTFHLMDTSVESAVIGVHFKPGGAFPFLGMPSRELHGQCAPLDSLWGAEAELLREQLLSAPDDGSRFTILEQALLARLRGPLQHHRAVHFAMVALRNGRAPIRPLAARIGISQTRLIQLFDAEVGLTPKMYSRVRRFQHVLRAIQPLQNVDWSEISLAGGYYDQSHLSNDFREFAGYSPGEYLLRRTPHLNHLPA